MKGFTDIFIRRPVFATVLSLIILLVGIRAYFALPVRQYPKVESSVVTVNVTYPGASAALMESFVTKPIEDSLAGIEGLDYINSNSMQNSSMIIVHFKSGYDLNAGINDVNAQISSIKWQLPQDINDPVVSKYDPNATPIMYISFTSGANMSREQVTDYLLRVVKPQLQTLDGVGSAQILGAREYAMRIWLNPYLMAARGVTASDIMNVLRGNNLQSTAGRINGGNWQEFNVTADTDVSTQQQFNDLVVRNVGGNLVRIKDIGRAELGAANTRFSAIMDDRESIAIAITPKSNANPLSVSELVRNVMPEIKNALPQGMHAKIVWEASDYISRSISEVKSTILEAALFVTLVIFLFLGSFRMLLIPVVTIPLSLIGVCGIMLMLGYSVNLLTLLAMVLAIGMVVDDAIVVSENIHRHMAAGQQPFKAALFGAREIKFAVISMTLTLAAVYAPIGFMTGLVGSLFREFAYTLAFAVIISGFIALTLSPMMCSKVMTADTLTGRFPTFAHHVTDRLMRGYGFVLRKFLKIRPLTLLAVGVIIVACYILFTTLPAELAPKEDEGHIATIITAPSSSSLGYTEKYTNELIKIYKSVPEMSDYGIINGFNLMFANVATAVSFMKLTDWDKRKRSVDQIIQQIFPPIFSIPGIMAVPVNPSTLPGVGGILPVDFVLKTTGSYDELNKAMQKLLAAARQNPNLLRPDADLKIDKPQIDIKISRNKAGDLGINMVDIADTLTMGLAEPNTISHFTMGGRRYDVIPQLDEQFRDVPDDLNNLNLRSQSGEMVPLSNLVKVKESIQPETLNHFAQLRSATLTSSLVPGYALGDALKYLQNAAKKIMPRNMQIDYDTQSRQFIEASGKMLITFLFAIIFIYLVLSAQFESFRDPLVVMFSVPLSTLGALAAVHLIHGTMNIYSQIGLLTLVGLITKHGILMVEFANHLQEQGESLREAIIKAASIRLRPVLMTTLAMILGALPLALATGAGAISRRDIGWVIVGGMTIGTIFTLFVVPTMYTYLATQKEAVLPEQEVKTL